MALTLKGLLGLALCACVVGAIEIPSTCAAQQAARNQAQIRKINTELESIEKTIAGLRDSSSNADRVKLEERLSAAERSLTALQANPPPTEQQKTYLHDAQSADEKLKEMTAKLSDSTLNISKEELSIANYFFTIFIGLFVVLGAIGAVAIVFIQRGATELILSKARRAVENEINERVNYESSLTLASAYSRLGVSWYEYYEPLFQRYKQEQQGVQPLVGARPEIQEILRELHMAKHFSDQGLEIYNTRLDEARRKTDKRAWHTHALLINQNTYHLTVSALCEGWAARPQEPFRREALRSAETCLKLSDDTLATGDLWYNLKESAAFAMVTLGDPLDQATGRDCLRNL
ncbi:MAG TPA: hypothetical protein VHU22_14045, partial [Xanthobacteraceae bacterium]|nr:hypothetical protein [Xanthobacteraceae bacterium]